MPRDADSSELRAEADGERRIARDPTLRCRYIERALARIPRLLGSMDRNKYRPTYGCLDRQYWHYRTAAFPSEMYQEGVLALALVYGAELPGNRWHGNTRIRELAAAGIRFAALSGRADGSCDDYYPFERALGAAVFSLHAAVQAYQLLDLNDAEILAWFERRADWIIRHDESGRLSNHHALAASALLLVAEVTGRKAYRDAADARIQNLLAWQSEEGWFEEYGGADPGYQTITIDCLAKYRLKTGDTRLDEPIRRAVTFARWFLHPDDSYGGEYGSRGTYLFYPHGMELAVGLDLAAADAADLADGFLRSLARGTEACFDDDRMFVHQLGNLIQAYMDWSPTRPALSAAKEAPVTRFFSQAQLLVHRTARSQTVISAARGGSFKHFSGDRPVVTDAGLILETTKGRVATSQQHHLGREVEYSGEEDFDNGRKGNPSLSVVSRLCWSRFETVGLFKQALLHVGMWTLGRWCRTLVRRFLQRRLITDRHPCPVRLSRCLELVPAHETQRPVALRVTDTIELTDPQIEVRRMSFGVDHQAAYVAACGVYQESVLFPWTDLAAEVGELNALRCVTVVREFS
jgi:hypothetical protein